MRPRVIAPSTPLATAPLSSVVAVRLAAFLVSVIAGWANFVEAAQAQAPPANSAPADAAPTGAVSAKLLRYSQRLIERHDANRDGHLDASEWSAMQGQPALSDLNRDGQVTADEFARYAAGYGAGRRIRLSTRGDVAPGDPMTPDAGSTATTTPGNPADPLAADQRRGLQFFAPLPSGTPSWFAERDKDGDAQLTLAEFSPRLRTAEIGEFKRYDLNGDGLLTIPELTKAASKPTDAATSATVPTRAAPAKP